MKVSYEIRPIKSADNPQVATLIRTVMPEFGARGPGFAITDPEVDHMFEAYDNKKSSYFVLFHDEKIIGGGGVAPLEGGAPDTCELKKMYFLAEARGLGYGKKMLKRCLQAARELGFRKCYLETLENMNQAKKLYERSGFQKLSTPMGTTGHFGCNAWYLLIL